MDYDEFARLLDQKKHYTKKAVEYWEARDIRSILGYETWQNFESAIERAIDACKSIGVVPAHHFSGVTKRITAGKGAQVPSKDFFLSRYACYLIGMNGDPRKPKVAMAQTYFAIQTRRQETLAQLTEAERRVEKRQQVRNHNKELASAAKRAGVISGRFGIFQDYGYRGLYDMNAQTIKQRKGIPTKENLLDYAGFEELAANDFRITQTARQLTQQNVKTEMAANDIHYKVGRKVRETIIDLGNPTPERLPIEPHIKTLTKKKSPKQLQLKKN